MEHLRSCNLEPRVGELPWTGLVTMVPSVKLRQTVMMTDQALQFGRALGRAGPLGQSDLLA